MTRGRRARLALWRAVIDAAAEGDRTAIAELRQVRREAGKVLPKPPPREREAPELGDDPWLAPDPYTSVPDMDREGADPLIGTLIDGRYRVRSWIARGGMATVYAATDERLDRPVALKIVHPHRAGDPAFTERFGEEARAIARLTHPNVVAVYDQGSHEGLPYLVIEYVHGRTLRQVLSDRRLHDLAEGLGDERRDPVGLHMAADDQGVLCLELRQLDLVLHDPSRCPRGAAAAVPHSDAGPRLARAQSQEPRRDRPALSPPSLPFGRAASTGPKTSSHDRSAVSATSSKTVGAIR